ncbi:ribosome-associated translation inhibitor RaiA [bacterium]|jgi:putative sigma-54 modulation protein|nr:ribosome-associated translation inhibitor RaiA [bacterium]
MNLNMSFKHLEPTESIKAYTSDKSEKLSKYFRGKISVTWNFAVEKQSQIAHVHLVGNHMDYFGEAESSDLYASIDLAIDKVEKQLRKHKEIVKDHLHKNGHRTPTEE